MELIEVQEEANKKEDTEEIEQIELIDEDESL